MITVYVTYSNAVQLWSRGLAACNVWFAKPIYLFREWKAENLPFETAPDRGFLEYGWHHHAYGNHDPNNFSFGKVFGYSDGDDKNQCFMANFVWARLCEHFQNAEFGHEWYRMEQKGIVHPKDFMVEMKLKVVML